MKIFYSIYLFTFCLFSFENFATPFDSNTFQQIECKISPLSTGKAAGVKPRTKPGRRFIKETSDSPLSTPCMILNQRADQVTNLNWSGYLALTSLSNPVVQSVQGVAGEWIVPTLLKSKNKSCCSIFVGLDGFSGTSLEQIGTRHYLKKGRQENCAWFQIEGQMYEIQGFLLSPGDHIGAGVSYKENNNFQLTIVNYTKNIYLPIPSSYTQSSKAERNSAEWIVEVPKGKELFSLANFGKISFFNCRAEINGITDTLDSSHFAVLPLLMTTKNGALKASPTGIKMGNSFSVDWKDF